MIFSGKPFKINLNLKIKSSYSTEARYFLRQGTDEPESLGYSGGKDVD